MNVPTKPMRYLNSTWPCIGKAAAGAMLAFLWPATLNADQSAGPDGSMQPSMRQCHWLEEEIVCASHAQRMYRASIAQSSRGTVQWEQITLPHPYSRIEDFYCSSKGKQYCIIIVRQEPEGDVNLIDVSLAALQFDPASNVVSVIEAGNIQLTKPIADTIGVKRISGEVVSYYSTSPETRSLVHQWSGRAGSDSFGYIPVVNTTGEQTGLARYNINTDARTASLTLPGGVQHSLEFQRHTSWGTGIWASAPEASGFLLGIGNHFPANRAPRPTRRLWFQRAVASADGSIEIQNTAWEAQPSDRIHQQISPSVDANGDAYFVAGTAQGPIVTVLCREDDGSFAFKTLTEPDLRHRLGLNSSPLRTGVELVMEAPGNLLSFRRMTLNDAGHGLDRRCSHTAVVGIDSLPGSEGTGSDHTDIANGVGSGGPEILRTNTDSELPAPALVISRTANASPTAIIIDVYGAAGLSPRAPLNIIRPLDQVRDDFWAAHAILPGDGDLGWGFARSAASPNRAITVQALIALSDLLVQRHPTLSGNITLRGISGGGGVIAEAVARRPDLFSGALIFAGAYDWRVVAAKPNFSGFFGVIDQVNLETAWGQMPRHCEGAKFLIFHAMNDTITPFSQAEAFADTLQSRGCLVGTVFLGSGGHGLWINAMTDAEASQFKTLVEERASRPLFRDLDLARRMSDQ